MVYLIETIVLVYELEPVVRARFVPSWDGPPTTVSSQNTTLKSKTVAAALSSQAVFTIRYPNGGWFNGEWRLQMDELVVVAYRSRRGRTFLYLPLGS
jgi:hypothetical protein